jgi:hypothetical protein
MSDTTIQELYRSNAFHYTAEVTVYYPEYSAMYSVVIMLQNLTVGRLVY